MNRKPSRQIKRQTLIKYIAKAIKLGASKARLISTASVVTGQWVRMKCQYGCDGYGQCLTCPPYACASETTAKMLKEYRRAILIHGNDHTDISAVAVKLERMIFLDGYYKVFAFGAGPCRLCSECNLKACTHAYEARPSMEASGIDVYQTAHNNGYPITVITDQSCHQNYYSLVLIE